MSKSNRFINQHTPKKLNPKDKNIEEKDTWELVHAFFEHHGQVQHQIESYNDFIENGLPQVFENNRILTVTCKDKTYKVEFGECILTKPTHGELNGNIRNITPMECINRDITYEAELLVDIETTDFNGHVNRYPKEIIGQIPVMVRSNLCNLRNIMHDKKELAKLKEDFYDPGGDFIINGGRKVVTSQERTAQNAVYVFANKKTAPKYTLFAQVRSGSLTGSHSTTTEVGIMKDGLISVTLPYIELTSIPLGVLYRALGVVGDIKNIVSYILPDFKDKEALDVLIKSLEHSLEISSQDQALLFIGKKGVKFTRPQKYRIEEPEKEIKDSKKKSDLKRKIKLVYDEFSGEKKVMTHEALLYTVVENAGFDSKPYKIAKEVSKEDEKTKTILIKILKEKMNLMGEDIDQYLKELIDIDDETKQAISYARHLLTAELFPHLESTESNFINKRFYLGYMTFKLLQVVLKRSTLQDRDHFANKRVATSGVLLRQQFEGSFRRMRGEIENSIERSIRGGSSTIKVTSYINPKTITNAMRGALSDNSWGARGKNQGVSQKTDQFNFISALSNLRKVVTPISQEGGKIDAPRKLHSSQWGITCLAETPEGKKCLTLDTKIKTKYGEREMGNLKNGDIVFTWDIKNKFLVQSKIKDYFTDEKEVFKIVCDYNYNKEIEKSLAKTPAMVRSKREKLNEIQKTYIRNSELEHFSIEATKDHPFLTKDGWKELRELKPGDKVYIFKIKDYYPISSIESQGIKTVADFTTVSDNHNFIANEFVTHNCGLIKNLALGSYITIGSDPRPILEYFQTMDIIKFEEYNNTNENLLRLTKIFVNGSPLGVTKYPDDFVRETRILRRGNLNPETSISYNKSDNEIKISTEAGRLCRPLLIVENGKILLKKSHIQEIREGKWNYPSVWQNLLEGGFIEFIDKSEEEDLLIALSPSEFHQKNSKIYEYTHCELNSSLIFGVGASLIPYPDHNQCIHEEEPVLMADGSCKKIKDVVVGDEVFTFHPETQEKSITKVVQTYNGPTDKTMFEITTLSGRKIKATYDHRFMTSKGWKQLGEISGETYIAISLDPKPIFRKKTQEVLCVDKQAMIDCLWKSRGMNDRRFSKFELESIYSNSPKLGFIARLYGYFMSGAEPNKEVNDECKMCFGQPFKECIPCFESFANDKLPEWLMTGQEFIKREFLAGFKGGSLGGICYENNIAYEKVKVSFKTAKYIRKYYQDVLELYKSFGFRLSNILPTKPPELKGKNAYKRTHLVSATSWKTEHSFIIAEKQMEESVNLIGYRYDKTKMIRASIVIEYLKTKSYLRSSKEPEDQKKIRGRMYQSFEDWEKDIKVVDTTLFVPVMFVKKIPTVNIADITTESDNHSFLSGDCFCVHNSPRNTYQCIWKEEQVLMGDGSLKKIKDIQIGDEVISFNPITLKKKKTNVIHHHVSPTNKKMVKLTTLDDKSIIVTEDHKIITQNGWIEAGKLIPMQSKVGISTIDIVFITLKSVEEVSNVEIADITTKSKNHSFIAGQGFCVHNSAMGKQAIGVPGSNYLHKTKGTFFAMDYPQKPLIASKTSRLIGFDDLPAGQNVIVSVCPWKGFNQEDSIIMNQDSIDRGFMNITAFMCYEAKLDRPGEKFEIPIESETNRFKGNTSKLELESIGNFGGNIYGTQRETEKHEHIFCYVPKGRKVEEGDTLIGKIISEDITGMTLNRKNKTDESVVYDQPWSGTIHAVHRGINGAGYPYIRIVVAQKRPPVFGDKFSARHGQQAIVKGKSLASR